MADQKQPTLADLFAAMEAESPKKGATASFIPASELVGVKFRFTSITEATNQRFKKDVIRFGIKLADGSDRILEMSPTADRKKMAAMEKLFVSASGTTTLVKEDAGNGKYTYKFK